MKAGTAQKILNISKPTLLKKIDTSALKVDKTQAGDNIFRWKHIFKLNFLEKSKHLPSRKIISICQNKGGVGKTTSVINLATAFSYIGKTLVIDLDSQSNLSQAFNIYLTEKDLSVTDVLEKPELIDKAIIQVEGNENLYVLPNHLKFELALQEYACNFDEKNFYLLKKALKDLKQEYNFILIDTPPQLGLALNISLYASDFCIIPFQAHAFSLSGIMNIVQQIEEISKKDKLGNFNPDILGIFINGFEENQLYNQVIAQLKEGFEVFDSKISKAIAIPQSQAVNKSIFEFDESNKVCYQYYNLLFEILEKVMR